jgi:hypothetical protein
MPGGLGGNGFIPPSLASFLVTADERRIRHFAPTVPKGHRRRKILNMVFICLRAPALTPTRMLQGQYAIEPRDLGGYRKNQKLLRVCLYGPRVTFIA